MAEDRSLLKNVLLLVIFLSPCIGVFGQDLGSSNGLFNPSKSKTNTKTTPKKPAAKFKKESNSVDKTASKSKSAAPKSTNPAQSKNVNTKLARETKDKNKITPKIAATENIIITVGKLPSKPENYNTLFEQSIKEGNAARDEREYTMAEAAYQRAQNLKTGDSRAIYGMGNLYSDQQRWEEAENAYRAAIQLEPDLPEAYIALSFVLTQPIVGIELSERYAEAEKWVREALRLDAKNSLAYDQLGVALELRGKISDETKNSYRRAIELDPKNALAYAHQGRLLRRLGMRDQSSAAYSQAIRLANDVPTMILVADVMQSQQRYQESEQLLRRALSEDSKNPTALYLLGRALTIQSNYDEAEKILKKSAEVSPKSYVAYELLGSLSTRRKKFNDAEKYLMTALKLASPNEKKQLAVQFENLGNDYRRLGRKTDALRVYLQAVSLDSGKADLLDKISKMRAN